MRQSMLTLALVQLALSCVPAAQPPDTEIFGVEIVLEDAQRHHASASELLVFSTLQHARDVAAVFW